jgi:hypothetical protein
MSDEIYSAITQQARQQGETAGRTPTGEARAHFARLPTAPAYAGISGRGRRWRSSGGSALSRAGGGTASTGQEAWATQ